MTTTEKGKVVTLFLVDCTNRKEWTRSSLRDCLSRDEETAYPTRKKEKMKKKKKKSVCDRERRRRVGEGVFWIECDFVFVRKPPRSVRPHAMVCLPNSFEDVCASSLLLSPPLLLLLLSLSFSSLGL